jgi:hypothetical protein
MKAASTQTPSRLIQEPIYTLSNWTGIPRETHRRVSKRRVSTAVEGETLRAMAKSSI